MWPFVLATPLVLTSITTPSSFECNQKEDICVSLDQEFVLPNGILNDEPYNAGHITASLCSSQVQTFVAQHDSLSAAAGTDRIESAVINLIEQTGVQCCYPPHAVPSVASANDCTFVCVNGFVGMPADSPTSCNCPPGQVECDDQCGQSDCKTLAHLPRQKSSPKSVKNQATTCDMPDANWGEESKCTDVTSDSSPDGICINTSPLGKSLTDEVACRLIPTVIDASCLDGECFVYTCENGFMVSGYKTECVPITHGRSIRDTIPYVWGTSSDSTGVSSNSPLGQASTSNASEAPTQANNILGDLANPFRGKRSDI